MLCFFICLFFCHILLYNDIGGKMKKIAILVTILFMLTGCSKTTYDEISYSELNEKLENKEDFILFIGSSTCSACAAYEITLNDIIEEYNVDVKYIDLSKLSDGDESALVSEFPITGTPATIFITDGDEKDTHNRIDGNEKKSKIIEKFKENGYIKD